jgi:hypothetical protein
MVAKEYGLLPSFVRDHATTYDLMVMDVCTAWEQYQKDCAEGKSPPSEVDQDTLMTMMKNVKG